MAGSWYVQVGEKSVGPASSAELLRAHFLGRYGAEALVRDGAGDWRTLGETFPLSELNPPPIPVGAPQTEATGSVTGKRAAWASDTPYAWRRYFARQMDTILHAYIMFVFLGALLAGSDAAYEAMAGLNNALVLNVIGVVLAMAPSAILIGVTGRSVGKLIFGLKVLKTNGKPPGLLGGFKRELQVLWQGLALGVPLITLVTFIGGYNKLHREGHTDWDDGNGLVMWYRRPGVVHWILMIFGVLAWLVIVSVLYAAGRDAG